VSDAGSAGRDEPSRGEATAEGTGETVGEAKWAALRDLERRFPGIDKADVRFEVLAEGERGLLGVGYAPARVIAAVAAGAPAATHSPAPVEEDEPGTPPALLREMLMRTTAGLGVSASVSVSESDAGLAATFGGPDVALLIGKRGQTIDAIQYLANAILAKEAGERLSVVVDAAGYRDRRRTTLERTADGAAREALASGRPVALEPMSAAERKLVHTYLQGRGDVATASEGTDPNRHVVVAPAPPAEP
jgi:spoIIIJ-associated protein